MEYLNSIGFGLILTGSLMSNMLYLRILMLIGNVFLLLWGLLVLHSLSTTIWEVFFILFHGYYTIKIFYLNYKTLP